ncbi:MAG TPA: DNA-3-methyladenine glycosylase 2 family protein [Roseiarcus sp.]|nr:DNA-3-methyladenine glycosylase 2 family protein [Roseiarcus sp.]
MADSLSKKRGGGKRAKKRAAAPQSRNLDHPGPVIDCAAALEAASARLLALDPEVVGRLLAVGGPPPLRWREPGFAGLAAIIVSQQVSVASADAIFRRLETELAPLGAASVLAADDAALKRCGLSQPKMRALRALAEATAGGLDLEALGALEARQAHDALIAVTGIGPWTADLFLLFCLGHPDAFPAGDLALQEAARIALGLARRPDARRLERIAERWRPLRGVAARMLWAYYRAVKQREGVAGR